MNQNKNCGCACHKMSATFLILIAIVFFLNNVGFLGDYATGVLWPVFLALIGFKMLFGNKCKCCNKGCCDSDKCSCCGKSCADCQCKSKGKCA